MNRKLLTVFLLASLPLAAWTKGDNTEESSINEMQRGVFNHVGIYLGPGSEGINFGVSACVTSYLELSAGMSIVPSIKLSDEVDVDLPYHEISEEHWSHIIGNSETDMNVDFARTTFDVKASFYPWGGKSKFCIVTGLSFGGKELAKISAFSDLAHNVKKALPQINVTSDFEDYEFSYDNQGNLKAEIRGYAVRPYLGIGIGRMIPSRRVGFRFDFGCQYMGKIKFHQNGREVKKKNETFVDKGESNGKKFYEKIPVYPVLRFTLTGRIL